MSQLSLSLGKLLAEGTLRQLIEANPKAPLEQVYGLLQKEYSITSSKNATSRLLNRSGLSAVTEPILIYLWQPKSMAK